MLVCDLCPNPHGRCRDCEEVKRQVLNMQKYKYEIECSGLNVVAAITEWLKKNKIGYINSGIGASTVPTHTGNVVYLNVQAMTEADAKSIAKLTEAYKPIAVMKITRMLN